MTRWACAVLALAAVLLGPGPVAGQDLATQFDEYVESQVKARKFMGSVLVASDGKVLFKKGYGQANLELDVPNRPDTKFRLGSITKQFAAAAILKLEEQGKLSVDDPVCKHVPACPQAWQPVTIHHLLTHTSGIPNFTSFPDYSKTWALPSRPDQTLARFKDKALEFTPGDSWNYSNSGYILLGYLIEKVSGEKYESYLRKNVFDPAGMNDSGHDSNEEIIKNRAMGYSRASGDAWRNSSYHDMTIPIGGGDLYSTVEDLFKWDQALVSGRVLSAKSMAKMYTPVRNKYGYGSGVDAQYGRKRLAHGGGINGFATHFARFPEQRAMVAVLGNMDFANSGQIASELVRLLFGEKRPKPEDRKEVPVELSKLSDYVGQYEMMRGVLATVRLTDGKLSMTSPGGPAEVIAAEADDRFFSKSSDRVYMFRRDGDGKVSAAVMVRDGVETDFKKISSEVPAPPAAVQVSAGDLDGLAGEYRIGSAFGITVTVEGDKIYGQATGQPRFEMFAEAKDKFFLKVVEAKIQFRRGPDGKADQLTLFQAGREVVMARN